VAIAARETAGSLHDKLARVGGAAVAEALQRLQRERNLPTVPQPETGVTYAAKIDRGEALVDWRQDASAIDRQIRAFNPAPGAHAMFGGESVKLWQATPGPGRFGAPGTVVHADATGIAIACGEGTLTVTVLQRPGGRRLPAAAFLAGHPVATGTRWDGADG
jgi:methionyl-tRNA formyltransferase